MAELFKNCRKNKSRFSLYCQKCENYNLCWKYEERIKERELFEKLNEMENVVFEDYKGNLLFNEFEE